jgi:hypothetical protein
MSIRKTRVKKVSKKHTRRHKKFRGGANAPGYRNKVSHDYDSRVKLYVLSKMVFDTIRESLGTFEAKYEDEIEIAENITSLYKIYHVDAGFDSGINNSTFVVPKKISENHRKIHDDILMFIAENLAIENPKDIGYKIFNFFQQLYIKYG